MFSERALAEIIITHPQLDNAHDGKIFKIQETINGHRTRPDVDCFCSRLYVCVWNYHCGCDGRRKMEWEAKMNHLANGAITTSCASWRSIRWGLTVADRKCVRLFARKFNFNVVLVLDYFSAQNKCNRTDVKENSLLHNALKQSDRKIVFMYNVHCTF